MLPETALVRNPDHLSAVETATLPCAAVTAWQALMVPGGGLHAGDTLLVQGTGGVALFGLQLAVAIGARAIVISPSEDSCHGARTLGAPDLINYSTTPDRDRVVLERTGGARRQPRARARWSRDLPTIAR